MSLVIGLLMLVTLWGAKPYLSKFNIAYMDKYQTTVINGVFIILVFLTHFAQYVKLGGVWDKHYMLLRNVMGQLVVVTFMFYSGYGIMCSILSKGEKYISQIPKGRILKTLIHFDIAVIVYFLIRVYQHKIPKLLFLGQSLIAYKSLGNSDWYIFGIMMLWLITFLVFKFVRVEENNIKVGITTALVIMVCCILYKYKPHWWYDTLICYPLGMYWALYKEKIDKFFSQNKYYWLSLIALIFCFILASRYRKALPIYELRIMLFAVTVAVITMKIKLQSKILYFAGSYLFEIYILMRVPMILCKPYFKGHNYMYFVVCVVLTILLTYVFHKLYQQIDKKLLRN